MSRFVAVLDEADGLYGAVFPDASGCTAMGATVAEVVDNAADALAEWVSDVLAAGGRMPAPRSLDEIAASDDGEGIAGRTTVLVPLLLDTGKLARANISIDAGLLADIDDAARRHGVTRSAFLAAAARDKIRAGA